MRPRRIRPFITALFLCFFALPTLTAGCAITQFGTRTHLVLDHNKKSFSNKIPRLTEADVPAVSLITRCNYFVTYSFMISPVIPLPPIIPFWDHTPEGWTSNLITITLTNPKFDHEQFSILLITDRGTSFYPSLRVIHLYDGKTELEYDIKDCKKLENATIKFRGLLFDGQPISIDPLKTHFKDHYGFKVWSFPGRGS